MPGNENIETTLQFNADISDFKGAMTEASRSIGLANSKFKAASSEMDDWSKSTDGLKAKIQQLTDVNAAEQRKLAVLEEAYAKVAAEQGENSKGAVELATKINNQKAAIGKTQKELNKYSNKLEDCENGTGEFAERTEEASKSLDGLGTVAGVVGKGLAAVGAVIAGAVTGFFASAEATRDYRREMAQLSTNATSAGQNVGKMKDVLSGVSAVTGDTEAAMEGLNMLMATGLDTQNLEFAAEAFAGAATKFDGLNFESISEGLQETLATGAAVGPFAELIERSGGNLESFNAKLASCSNEAERQEVVMSWLAESGLKDVHDAYVQNNSDLVAAEQAQFRLNDAMAEVGAIAEPIMTSLKNTAAGLLEAITPFVALIGEGLTMALSGAAGASDTLSAGITGLFDTIATKATETLPMLLDLMATAVPSVVSTIAEALPQIVTAVVDVVPQIVTSLLALLPTLLESVVQITSAIITGLGEMLPQIVAAIIEVVPQLITALLENAPLLLESAITFLMAIVEAVPELLTQLLTVLPDIVNTISAFLTDNIDLILDAAITLLMAIIEAIPDIIDALVEALPEIVTTILTAVVDAVPDLLAAAVELFWTLIDAAGDLLLELPGKMLEIGGAIIDGIGNALPDIGKAAKEIFDTIWNAIKELPGEVLGLGGDIVRGLWNGIDDMTDWIGGKIKGFCSNALGAIKNFFGIASPSRLMRDEVGKMLGAGMAEGITGSLGTVQSAMRDLGKATLGGMSAGVGQMATGGAVGGKQIIFNQTNNSPRALSRREIYRQTHNALAFAGGVL